MEEVTAMRSFVICKDRNKVALLHVIKACRVWRHNFTHPQTRPLSHAQAVFSPVKAILVPIERKFERAEDLMCYSQYPRMLMFLR